jgi:regulator of cell morphogenesis and NO signaling
MTTAYTQVRELAVTIPGATRVFEKVGIDYCCGGERSLHDACVAAQVDEEALINTLEQLRQHPQAEYAARPEQAESLAKLIDHIIDVHHEFTREEIVRIDKLLIKVCGVHGANHTELLEIQALFRDLAADLGPHMHKEELMLFPYIRSLERAALAGRGAPPCPFGTVNNPVRMMRTEHDVAGVLLAKMRSLSNDYTPPEDACVSYQTLYQALDAFEKDLHEHIHLENNLLFPKAVAMEDAV